MDNLFNRSGGDSPCKGCTERRDRGLCHKPGACERWDRHVAERAKEKERAEQKRKEMAGYLAYQKERANRQRKNHEKRIGGTNV